MTGFIFFCTLFATLLSLTEESYRVKMQMTCHFPIVEVLVGENQRTRPFRLAVDTGNLVTWLISDWFKPQNLEAKMEERLSTIPRYDDLYTGLSDFNELKEITFGGNLAIDGYWSKDVFSFPGTKVTSEITFLSVNDYGGNLLPILSYYNISGMIGLAMFTKGKQQKNDPAQKDQCFVCNIKNLGTKRVGIIPIPSQTTDYDTQCISTYGSATVMPNEGCLIFGQFDKELVRMGRFYEVPLEQPAELQNPFMHWSIRGKIRFGFGETDKPDRIYLRFDSGSGYVNIQTEVRKDFLINIFNKRFKLQQKNIKNPLEYDTFACPLDKRDYLEELPDIEIFLTGHNPRGKKYSKTLTKYDLKFILSHRDYILTDYPNTENCSSRLGTIQTFKSELYRDNSFGVNFFNKYFIGLDYGEEKLIFGYPDRNKEINC